MYKDLIDRLRDEAEWAEGNEWETPIMLHDDLTAAADAIEKLSAELSSYSQVSKVLRYRGFDNFGILLAAYDKVKKERDAAVADLTAAGLCNYCKHWGIGFIAPLCVDIDIEKLRKCTKRGKCEFEWRGGGC